MCITGKSFPITTQSRLLLCLQGKSEYEDATYQRRECSNEVTVEIMDKRAHYGRGCLLIVVYQISMS